MSIKVMVLVWESDLPRDEKYICLALADWANDEGESVYPSIGRVHWKTKYSRRQVVRLMQDLEGRGVLTQQGTTDQGVKRFKINVDALPTRPPYDPQRDNGKSRKGEPDPEDIDQDEPQNTGGVKMSPPIIEGEGCQNVTQGVPKCHPEGVTMSPDSLFIPSVESPVKNTAAKPAAVSDPPESEFPEIVKNPRALKALQDFEKNRQAATANGGGPDLSQWPEDCRPWVKKFCDLWQIEPPRPTGKKGGDFGLWIQESRYLAEAAGEFGTMVLERVYSDHESERKEKGKAPFMVSRPGSLIKAARAKAGELRRAGVVPGPGQPDPRQESLEDYLARVAEQKAANERYMAEVRAKRDEMVKQGVGVYGGAK